MIMNDKMEREKAESRNAVEEYVYALREKLIDEYKDFVTDEVIFSWIFNLLLHILPSACFTKLLDNSSNNGRYPLYRMDL